MATSKAQINTIRQMIKSGKRNEAVNRLVQLIERDHNNTELWWLLANATTDPFQSKLALEELLSINPNDERAQKMLTRLETRDVLNQMGIAKAQQSNNRRMFVGGFLLALAVVIILLLGFSVISNATRPVDVASIPTRFVLPTETDTPVPTATNTPTPIPTETPTPVPTSTEIVEVDAGPPGPNFTPDIVVDIQEPVQLDNVNIGAETTEEPLPQFAEATAEVNPVVENPNTQLPLNTTTTNTDTTTTVTTGTGTGTGSTQNLPSESIPARAVSEMRGQVLAMQPRQEIIEPYGEHGYTFSGYRDELISLELINITGQGNPSLELRDADGNVIAQDIDTRSGDNTDASVEVRLPADGIYTVVVRMASTDEQLYYLNLSRLSTP